DRYQPFILPGANGGTAAVSEASERFRSPGLVSSFAIHIENSGRFRTLAEQIFSTTDRARTPAVLTLLHCSATSLGCDQNQQRLCLLRLQPGQQSAVYRGREG